PLSWANVAVGLWRRAGVGPTRVVDSFTPAAITRTCHVATSPGPGPFAVNVVFPARLPINVPVAGSKVASDVSATVQRIGASGTGALSAASACTWNFATPWIGRGTSALRA